MSFLIDYSYCYNVMLHLLFTTTNVSCFIGYSYANSISSSIGLNILMLPVSCFIGFHIYHCVMLHWLFTTTNVSCSIGYSYAAVFHPPLVILILPVSCFICYSQLLLCYASLVIHSYHSFMLNWLFTATTVSCYIEYSHVTTKLCFVGYSYATRVMLYWLFTCYHCVMLHCLFRLMQQPCHAP